MEQGSEDVEMYVLVSCTRSSLHKSRDIPPKISPYPSFPKRGIGVDGEESPFEKGGNRGI
jgi:hypothetical protein